MLYFAQSRILQLIYCVASALALAACGGGGGSTTTAISTPTFSTAPVTTTTPVTNTTNPAVTTSYSQEQVKAVAGLGFLNVELLESTLSEQHLYFAGVLQAYSSSPAVGSETATTSPCLTNGVGTGTVVVSSVKSGVYQGLKANDTLSFNFSNCRFGTVPKTRNGAVTLTALATYANVSSTVFNIQYKARTRQYSLTTATEKAVSSGVQDVTLNYSAGNFQDISTTVSNLQADILNISLYSTTGTFTLGLFVSPSTAFAFRVNTSTFSTSINGTVSNTTGSPTSGTFVMATPTPLTGAYSSTSTRYAPTAGVLRAKEAGKNIQTSTAMAGANGTVSGDSDRNGSLDMVFTLPYTTIAPI